MDPALGESTGVSDAHALITSVRSSAWRKAGQAIEGTHSTMSFAAKALPARHVARSGAFREALAVRRFALCAVTERLSLRSTTAHQYLSPCRLSSEPLSRHCKALRKGSLGTSFSSREVRGCASCPAPLRPLRCQPRRCCRSCALVRSRKRYKRTGVPRIFCYT